MFLLQYQLKVKSPLLPGLTVHPMQKLFASSPFFLFLFFFLLLSHGHFLLGSTYPVAFVALCHSRHAHT